MADATSSSQQLGSDASSSSTIDDDFKTAIAMAKLIMGHAESGKASRIESEIMESTRQDSFGGAESGIFDMSFEAISSETSLASDERTSGPQTSMLASDERASGPQTSMRDESPAHQAPPEVLEAMVAARATATRPSPAPSAWQMGTNQGTVRIVRAQSANNLHILRPSIEPEDILGQSFIMGSRRW
uniref:Uncharacterized protein n=1 Tax=Haptolina brevifila TaxID=156173 RepID=A0A7S2HIW0_9EUKA